MKKGFYLSLALTGIKKNGKLYLPFLLTGIMMAVMFYIISYLSITEALDDMEGDETLKSIMSLGTFIIGIFALIFLFYTNSFLIRRRLKEYGLYNMLGMGKKNIFMLIFHEVLISFLITVPVGIGFGILLSRLSEMLLFNLVGGIVQYSFCIPMESIVLTLGTFSLTYLLILINSLRIARNSKAVDLIRSESVGEKPPKSNVFLAVSGAVILAGAYYLAVAIEQPIEALFFFFIAVIMVIIGTYLLFIAGSVLICRILQKNKKYYYNPSHFVSVSQMSYRMKRNGAGLASICILLTMVLVTLSTTTCLFLGSEDSMHNRYPKEVNVRWMQYGYEDGGNHMEGILHSAVSKTIGLETRDGREYTEYTITGYLDNSNVQITLNSKTNMAFIDYEKVCEVHFIDIEDYNRLYGKNVSLEKGEAVVQPVCTDDLGDEFTCGGLTFKVKERLPDNTLDLFGSGQASVSSSMFVFIPDMYETVKCYDSYKDYDGGDMLCHCWYYEFDLAEEQKDETLQNLTRDLFSSIEGYDHWNLTVDSKQLKRSDFYGTFGGLLFLGAMLSLIFMTAAVLIIYYKQVSEGYEDQSRFEIMQKVGMTRKDIRKNINSQMKLLFLLPILAAAVHLAFAFPFMNRLLILFGLLNTKLLLLVTGCCLLAFAVIYGIAYKLTSNAYFKLVT